MNPSVVLCSLPDGGIAHYTYALAGALADAGLPTSVLMADSPAYDLTDFPHRHRTRMSLRVGRTPLSRAGALLQNLGAVVGAALRANVVHYQWPLGPRHDRVDWPALRGLGKRIVYTAHDVIPHESNVNGGVAHCQWLYTHADALIVHGERLREQLLENFTVDASRVHVIPHGNYNFVADTPGAWGEREVARASLGLEPQDRVVLFFGLIRPYKGVDDLLEAFRLLNQRGLSDGRRVKLVIAGRVVDDLWEKAGYARQIRDSGLTDHVITHLEHIPMGDVARFYRAADVVAVPYKRGSQSGVLQLAYSFGKPAVATQVGSLGENTPEGRGANFVPPEDPEALAEALRVLLEDHEAAARVGRAGRHYVDAELGWGDIARRTLKVYRGDRA